MATCLGKTFQYINNIIFVYYVDGDFGITSESLIYNDYKSDSAMENYNDKIIYWREIIYLLYQSKNQNQIISGISIILLFSDFRHYVTYIILIKQSNSESITKNKITFSVHVVCLVINTCRWDFIIPKNGD